MDTIKNPKEIEEKIATLEKKVENLEKIIGSTDISIDPFYDLAIKEVMAVGYASASHLQRHLHIGYSRAATLIDMMVKEGYIGPIKDSEEPKKLVKK